jgi:hypothetical protein
MRRRFTSFLTLMLVSMIAAINPAWGELYFTLKTNDASLGTLAINGDDENIVRMSDGFYKIETIAASYNVQITATPATGSYLESWSDNATKSLTRTVTVSKSTGDTSEYPTFTANFAKFLTLNIATNNAELGTLAIVKDNDELPAGVTAIDASNTSFYVMPNTQVGIKATPATGSFFDSWSDNADATVLERSITVSSDTTITANFSKFLRLNIATNDAQLGALEIVKDNDELPAGVTAIDESTTNFYVLPNTEVNLIATPITGSYLKAWSDGADSTLLERTIVMISDSNITATFAKCDTLILKTNNVEGQEVMGTLAIAGATLPKGVSRINNEELGDAYFVVRGACVNLTATPEVGYYLESWSDDADATVLSRSIRILGNTEITANFAKCSILTLATNNEEGLKKGTVELVCPEEEEIITWDNDVLKTIELSDEEISLFPNQGITLAAVGGNVEYVDNTLNFEGDAEATENFTFTANNGVITRIEISTTSASEASVLNDGWSVAGSVSRVWEGTPAETVTLNTASLNGVTEIAFTILKELPDGVTEIKQDTTYYVVPGTQVSVLAEANDYQLYHVENWTNEEAAEYDAEDIMNDDFLVDEKYPRVSILTITMGNDTTAQANFDINGYLVTVPAGEYITYYSDQPLTLIDDDFQLYVMTEVDAPNAYIKEIGTAAAKTPLLVYNYGEETAEVLLVIASEEDAEEVETAIQFLGTLEDRSIDGSDALADRYAFNGKQFVKLLTDLDITAHKCWIEIDKGVVTSRTINLVKEGDETTGIENVNAYKANDSYFDLNGRKVSKPALKGVYILNGKKVVVK